jgi:hypothetical protein
MRKLLTAGLTVLFALALAACAPGNNPNVDSPAAGDEIVPTATVGTTP